MSGQPDVTVSHVGGFATHVRAGLLSYLVSEGARHEPRWLGPWDATICPLCTYEAADVLAGVAWPCGKETTR